MLRQGAVHKHRARARTEETRLEGSGAGRSTWIVGVPGVLWTRGERLRLGVVDGKEGGGAAKSRRGRSTPGFVSPPIKGAHNPACTSPREFH